MKKFNKDIGLDFNLAALDHATVALQHEHQI